MIVIRRRKEIFGRSSAELRYGTHSACAPEQSASAEHYKGHVRCISNSLKKEELELDNHAAATVPECLHKRQDQRPLISFPPSR